MSQRVQENERVGLKDVFEILVQTPHERLLSLTFQLRESPEDNIIHALCLIVLRRQAQGLSKLHTIKDNYVAKHLAEKCQMSDGNLEDFAVHCGHFQEFTWENSVTLARIFRVLSEQRLCNPLLRNLAYMRALSSDTHKWSADENLEYYRLREEAEVTCGPEFVEWMHSSMDLKLGSNLDLHSNLYEGSPTLKVTSSQDLSESACSLPSFLEARSSKLSYPTHLEISTPPAASFQDGRRTPEASDKSHPNSSAVGCKARNTPPHPHTCEQHQFKSNHPPLFNERKHSRMEETFAAESIKLDSLISPTQTSRTTTVLNFALPAATNTAQKKHVANDADDSGEEEEEEIFYSFVILHAPEDSDMAEILRERLETVIGYPGATFSNDFAIPGKSTLRCMEDAINNTAFTLLLLTRNFNTRMLNMETDSALVNSLNKKHKYNTVIPLLPRENCMPRNSIPLVLSTLVPLVENGNFERRVQKCMSLPRIKSQKKIWAEEQRMKLQIRRQERLQQRRNQLIKESETAQLLEKENLMLLMTQKLLLGPGEPSEQEGEDGRPWWKHLPNIHIENAKYIMIGNDSQMTVDLGGGENKEDSVCKEEEQS
ncbi:TIR domain-containing adapter molecule 1 [Antennarius striatus]|uniref:TIR domain-containing adapter molecule 1 n=1 Tax=Antennarius striatus TaxID=241820 RepID=UPI0035ADE238